MENPTKPNIILITVDQMRYPMHFPANMGINTANDFIQQFMPNLYNYIWKDGVKFSNYYTAASDCTAGRATIHTGLYAYQTYSMLTLITYKDEGDPGLPQPPLQSGFPTIGHLMRARGYNTPYFGKWHLSYDAHQLTSYGYDSHTPKNDYVGYEGQGLATDVQVATDAASWLSNNYSLQEPFFFTVNFINPHDKQWFWGGMQGDDYNEVYSEIPVSPPEQPPQDFTGNKPPENQPPRLYGDNIATAITNWQSQTDLDAKPKTQTLVKEVFQYQMGGIWESDQVGPQQYKSVAQPPGFHYANTPLHAGLHKAIAPYEYWSKALDSYLQVSGPSAMGFVDDAIKVFIEGLPQEVRDNSIFVFTSDHGEYGSSHGLQGKGGTVYEEGIRVPLVVYDPRARFTTAANVERKQLASSVDLLRLIVSLGYGGTDDWLVGTNGLLYGNRCDLLSILRDHQAPGRNYALHTTDEFVPDAYNYLKAPLHVIGLIAMNSDGKKEKLGVYTKWKEYTSAQNQAIILNEPNRPDITELEYYDQANYLLETKPDEKTSNPSAQRARVMLETLFGSPISEILGLIGTELQAPLPTVGYQQAQASAYYLLQEYMRLSNLAADGQTSSKDAAATQELLARAWAF